MYETFFGLKENPFRMTPDPRYFYASSKHLDALNHMLYAIEERRGFVVITGEIGSGKTTLSRVLFQKLDARTKTAVIRNTKLTAKDLVTLTLEELDIPARPGSTKMQLIGRLNEFLIDQLRDDANVVLLIDEAQNLTPSVLEEVRMLANLETETTKLIQIILMGQPELKAKLWLKELTQLRQRVTLFYHLNPLNEPETCAYVAHRLQVAGAIPPPGVGPAGRAHGAPPPQAATPGGGTNGTPIFGPAALERIFSYSQGTPRLVNSLCDRALLTGYVNETKAIGPQTIDEVARELPSLIAEPAHTQ